MHSTASKRVELTYRQVECLQWVRAGKSSTEIARILNISADVVNEHIAKACKRLGVRRRFQAAAKASERDLLDR